MLQLPSFILLTFLALQLYHGGATINDIISSRPLFPNETLISSNGTFELGFFRPNISSNNHYVGIWYKNTSSAKVVWVANRNTPLPYSDQSASLTIGKDGNLKLLDGQKKEIWSTNVSASPSSSGSLSAILLDNGNFVLKDASSGIGLWESFANPSDTLVQTMKTEINVFTRTKNYLTCWKSEVDPSDGNFVVGITSDTPPEMFIWINGSIPYWRSGQWDKAKFNGIESMIESYSSVFTVQQDIQQGTTYFVINSYNSSEFRYIYLSSNGSLHLMYTDNRTDGWIVEWEAPTNPCEVYGTCGQFGICNIQNSPICSCLDGFVPNSVEEWSRGDWKGGCKRATELNCEKNTSMVTKKQDGFLKKSRVKLPDSPVYLGLVADDAVKCSTWCLNNCSCLAYTYVRTIGCMTWTNELMDVQQFSSRGEDLFLRLADINNGDAGNSRRRRELVISLTIISSAIVLGAALWALYKRRAMRKKSFTKIGKNRDIAVADGSSVLPNGITSLKEQLKGEDGQMLSVFYFDSILVATDNFSSENKLGQGGFGSVYKGKLQDGKSVAVKRLSSTSGQGMEEFKTEILLISKLQHRNLVRLIGCCIEEEEKILIYEYLPNKSLDTFLFNPTNKKKLNWGTRFQIIHGIARGLLYLHRDSHLRVIHRDLKASNVLLDEKLNPKISDFGLARIFEGTQDVVNTQRVVGTLGYMAPEYAMGGIFSEKSDIYSFGVLLLEIVSSMKNTSFYYNEQHVNLLSYTWILWKERRANDLLDQELLESSSLEEVEKCVQVGLMCVQNHAVERPHISSVIQMLNGELNLSEPKEPAFSFQTNLNDHGGQENSWSTVAVTISTTEGR